MAGLPDVSVVLPVYNGAPFLRECLDSLTAQTFRKFEIVLVDDGSDDATLDIYSAVRDDRLKIIRTEHQGLVGALKTGVAAARGTWIARMDADDVCRPERLEKQLAWSAAYPRLTLISCLIDTIDNGHAREGYKIFEQWQNSLWTHEQIMRDLYIESPIPHSSILIRKADLELAGGYRETGGPEDYDLFLRLAESGATFGKTPEILLSVRDHPGRITWTDSRYSVENFIRAKIPYLIRRPELRKNPVYVWGSGPAGKRISKYLLRAGIKLKGYIDTIPNKLTLRGLPVRSAAEMQDDLRSKEAYVLIAVSSRDVRQIIRRNLIGLGLSEPANFRCVA